MADQVDDAGLDDRIGEDGGDGLREALEAIDDRNQDIANAAILKFFYE